MVWDSQTRRATLYKTGPPYNWSKVSPVARAKLAKRGAPCSLVNCYRNKLVGRYGKVGYLTPIVRYHIKPAHPKRHPTKGPPISCSGEEFIIVVLPLSTVHAMS